MGKEVVVQVVAIRDSTRREWRSKAHIVEDDAAIAEMKAKI